MLLLVKVTLALMAPCSQVGLAIQCLTCGLVPDFPIAADKLS